MDEPCPDCGAEVETYTDEPLFVEPGIELTRTRQCLRCGYQEIRREKVS
jgi:endogenous inhibitor of DNA gyrase (YacG/DUF329 family)